MIVLVGFQFWLQSSLGGDDPELVMEQLLGRADGIIKAAGRVFPPSVWAAQAMAYAHTWQGWLNLLYVAALSALALFLLYLLGEKVFLQGLLAGLEGSRGTGRARQVELAEERARAPLMTVASLEWKLFVRDPGFALNGLIGYVLLPAMALLPLFGQKLQNNPFELLALDQLHPLVVAGGLALYFLFMTGMSMIPATTFSREEVPVDHPQPAAGYRTDHRGQGAGLPGGEHHRLPGGYHPRGLSHGLGSGGSCARGCAGRAPGQCAGGLFGPL